MYGGRGILGTLEVSYKREGNLEKLGGIFSPALYRSF